MSLNESLTKVVARFDELSELMADPASMASGDFASLSKEYSDLMPVVEVINELNAAKNEAADLAAMLVDGDTDQEMRKMAEDEFQALKESIPGLERNVQLMLLPRDEADDKNAILEVRAGTGGDEAALFAAELFRMYQRYAETRQWKFEIMSFNETGIGGCKEATASVSGRGVFARLST